MWTYFFECGNLSIHQRMVEVLFSYYHPAANGSRTGYGSAVIDRLQPRQLDSNKALLVICKANCSETHWIWWERDKPRQNITTSSEEGKTEAAWVFVMPREEFTVYTLKEFYFYVLWSFKYSLWGLLGINVCRKNPHFRMHVKCFVISPASLWLPPLKALYSDLSVLPAQTAVFKKKKIQKMP